MCHHGENEHRSRERCVPWQQRAWPVKEMYYFRVCDVDRGYRILEGEMDITRKIEINVIKRRKNEVESRVNTK